MKTLTTIFCLLLALSFATCQKPYIPDDYVTSKTKGGKQHHPKKPSRPDNNADEEEELPEVPQPPSGNTDAHVTVHDFLTQHYYNLTWVEGYIVGACSGAIKNAEWKQPFTLASAILLADDPKENNPQKVISIQLKSRTSVRKELNLVDNPQNQGRKIVICGYQQFYLGVIGIKNWGSNFEWK